MKSTSHPATPHVTPWTPPVRYDAAKGWIIDANGAYVCPCRAARSDEFNEEIAKALNAYTRSETAQFYGPSSREAVLLETIRLVRGYPDFDHGGPMAEAMDAVLRGETPKLLVDVAYLSQGLKPPSIPSATRESTPIGLFWQTADGRRHFCEGVFKRGDIHDNGRPIHIALLGEEAK